MHMFVPPILHDMSQKPELQLQRQLSHLDSPPWKVDACNAWEFDAWEIAQQLPLNCAA
jgi:hypothetical protein